jgi:hypothetical protein
VTLSEITKTHGSAIAAQRREQHPELPAAAGHERCEPPPLETNGPAGEAITELLPLGRGRRAPIGAEHEAADAGQIEILRAGQL